MMLTGRLSVPCWAAPGLICAMNGTVVTVKPLVSVTTSELVMSWTVRGPTPAAVLMLTTAVALVGELTVSETTLIPLPKDANVVPWTKWVNCPVMATDRFCWPTAPVLGTS